jgi:hypothetical protein
MEQDEMKLVVVEILEELKKLGDKKEQEEFIVNILKSKIGEGKQLQEFLDKFDTEINTLKAEFKSLPNWLFSIRKNLELMEGNIKAATLKLQEPITQRLSHHHHLKAGLILSIFFFMLLIFCIGGLYLTHQKANAYQEGAYKYEYIRLTIDKNSFGYLKKIDSLFKKNKPAMINYVDQEEEKLKQEIIVQRKNIDSVKVKMQKRVHKSL